MPFAKWLKLLLSRSANPARKVGPKSVLPTPQEMHTALGQLDELTASAILGEIGGGRPDKDNRAASWWGGNFLGSGNEDIPICNRSGRRMHPLLQIRIDELPEVPASFEGLALVNIWLDLQADTFWGPKNGEGFLIRTYEDLKGLVPLGVGFRESTELPSFPVFWREIILEQPSWEDMSKEVPSSVAQAKAADWFFESKYLSERYYELRGKYPVKIGGWPSWIQGADWPDEAEFVFQVDSTEKGKVLLGDAGSFYIFRTTQGWEIRGDCY